MHVDEIHMFAHKVGPFLPSTSDVIEVSLMCRRTSIFKYFNYIQTLSYFMTFWYLKERHMSIDKATKYLAELAQIPFYD